MCIYILIYSISNDTMQCGNTMINVIQIQYIKYNGNTI